MNFFVPPPSLYLFKGNHNSDFYHIVLFCLFLNFLYVESCDVSSFVGLPAQHFLRVPHHLFFLFFFFTFCSRQKHAGS